MPTTSTRHAWWITALGTLFIIASVGAGAYTLVPGRDRARTAGLRREIDRRVAVVMRAPWVRPVLRGKALDCNAAAVARDAMTRGDLSALRRSTQCSRSLRRADVLDYESVVLSRAQGQEMGRVSDLFRLVANAKTASECLRAAADVVRTVQDRAPWRGRDGYSYSFMAAGSAGDCASRATRREARDAAREFEILARTAPPIGASVELAVLSRASFYLETTPEVPLVPLDYDAVQGRFDVLDVVDAVLHARPVWQHLDASDYPASLDASRALPGFGGWPAGWVEDANELLGDDAREQAALRAAVVVLDDAARGRATGEPPALARWALRDPFTGSPLHWRRAADGALTVFSVGPDRAPHNPAGAVPSDDISVP